MEVFTIFTDSSLKVAYMNSLEYDKIESNIFLNMDSHTVIEV